MSTDPSRVRILVVDDERTLRESCASLLTTEGYKVSVAGRGDEAVRMIQRVDPEIVLLDLYLPDMAGVDVLAEALRIKPTCLVIAMTGKASVESSIEVLRAGAWSYIPKPFSAQHLSILIGRAAHLVTVARETAISREAGGDGASNLTLLGNSAAFKRVVQAARQVAATDASVFIHGESGTGKEMIAQFIHQNSRRASRPMVSINSAAMPEALLESEMFGHVAGAFTGATRDKKGLLDAANGGTLFLDEITEMLLPMQAKLLRVIQDGVVRRVGSIGTDAVVDVRFIAASNRDPAEAVRTGKLRKDLHYRLRVFPIEIPPLRERPEDVALLAQHYITQFWQKHRGDENPPPVLTADTMGALLRRPFAGNVRELRNLMEHTVLILPLGARTVDSDVLPAEIRDDAMEAGANAFSMDLEYHRAREQTLAEFERTYLRVLVRRARGNLSDAARLAGVDRTTLYRLMEKHEVSKGDLLTAGEM